MLPDTLCFVDVETTGMRPTWDRVIEIGAIRVENGKIVKRFETLLNPGGFLPPEITSLTGITTRDLDKAPSFWEIKQEFLNILEGAVFVAHNVRFDYSFLKNEFKRLGHTFSPKHFCTARLSRYLYPRYSSHSLDSLINRFGLKVENRHRALGDAQATLEFFQLAQKEIEEAKFIKAVNLGLKKPTVPVRLSYKEMDSLPETPGVYIFYGDKGAPLYVGKSVNIQGRVKNHFSSDHISGKEMKIAQQVTRVETIKTSGELGALLTESILVKSLQPLYNRMLRYSQGVIVLKQIEKDGYFTVKPSQVEEIDISELDTIIGVFKHKKQLSEYLKTLSDSHNLCLKVLGVENTLTHCFGYRLGKCFGACTGGELPLKYNLRFAEAFANTKIRPWPFAGPILISEVNELEGSEEKFLVDKWCFLGSYRSEEGLEGGERLEGLGKGEIKFNLDTYKIISSYIFNVKNQSKIKPLGSRKLEKLEVVDNFPL